MQIYRPTEIHTYGHTKMYNRNTRIRFEIEKNKVPRSDDILDMFINPHFHRDKVSEESVSGEQR